jgi:hypothetical protein
MKQVPNPLCVQARQMDQDLVSDAVAAATTLAVMKGILIGSIHQWVRT